MTDSLTIKDLNCETCNLSWCPMFASPGHKPTDSSVHHMITTAIFKVGCASHPLALQVMAGPIIAELARCKVQESLLPGEIPQETFEIAIDYAIKLLKGEVELP